MKEAQQNGEVPTTAKPWQDEAREFFNEWETRRNDRNAAPRSLERLRSLAFPPEKPAPSDELSDVEILDAAHKAWKENPDDPAVIRNLLKPPLLQPMTKWQNATDPPPIMWHDHPDDRYAHSVVSEGEVGILSSAGGTGKSYLSLAWAHAACAAYAQREEFGTACGMRVAAGPVAVISYEDTPERIAVRLKAIGGGPIPGALHVWEYPNPLWHAEAEQGGGSFPAKQWGDLWDQIRQIKAKLLIIDPASAALADVSTSETGPVRAFLRELAKEAKRAGCGVLIVGHNTKAARIAIAQGDLETGAADPIAGSSVWYDGARGVLLLARDRLSKPDRVLVSVKSNYGGMGWGARLKERFNDEKKFAGLELATRMDSEAVEGWCEDVRKKKKPNRPKPSPEDNSDPNPKPERVTAA